MDNLINFIKENQFKIQTPCYIYEKDKITIQVQKIYKNFPPDSQIFYSLKSNPNSKLLKIILSQVDGCDVSTVGEMKLVQKAINQKHTLSYVGPGKTYEDLEFAIINFENLQIVCESEHELNLITHLASKLDKELNVTLRINMAKRVLQGGRYIDNYISQFGIDESEVKMKFLQILSLKKIKVIGFHFHFGSNFLNLENIMANYRFISDFLDSIYQEFMYTPKFINFGGGLGINHYFGQSEPDLSNFNLLFNSVFDKLAYFQDESLVKAFEFGRFIVGPSGTFISKVLTKKRIGSKNILILDGGFSNNMALVGVDQVFKKNYNIFALQKTKNRGREKVDLFGPSCYEADVWARDIELPIINTGDILFVSNCGAYGKSYSPENFLTYKHASEILI